MRLADCFIELMAYVAYLSSVVEKEQPSFDKVKDDINRLIIKSEQLLEEFQLPVKNYDSARFAVFVWIDETIMKSLWNHRLQWKFLQTAYYNTNRGGIDFFERLDVIEPENNDIREVYFMCLALGFSGRYRHKEDNIYLNQLKSSNLKILTGSATGIKSIKDNLFPEAYFTKNIEGKGNKKKSAVFGSGFLFFTIPAIIYGILFFVYRFLLNNEIIGLVP